DELVLSGARVLGEGPPSDAEHLVARPEPGHAGSHLGDRASDVQPWDALLRTAEAEADDPHQVGLARKEMPGAPIHPSGTHLDEGLVRGDGGLVGFGQTQNVGGAVGVLDDRTHHILLAVPPLGHSRAPHGGMPGAEYVAAATAKSAV